MNIEPKSCMHDTAHEMNLFIQIGNSHFPMQSHAISCNPLTCSTGGCSDSYWYTCTTLYTVNIFQHTCSIINHKYVLPRSEITVCGYVGVPVHGICLSMNEVVYCLVHIKSLSNMLESWQAMESMCARLTARHCFMIKCDCSYSYCTKGKCI